MMGIESFEDTICYGADARGGGGERTEIDLVYGAVAGFYRSMVKGVSGVDIGPFLGVKGRSEGVLKAFSFSRRPTRMEFVHIDGDRYRLTTNYLDGGKEISIDVLDLKGAGVQLTSVSPLDAKDSDEKYGSVKTVKPGESVELHVGQHTVIFEGTSKEGVSWGQ